MIIFLKKVLQLVLFYGNIAVLSVFLPVWVHNGYTLLFTMWFIIITYFMICSEDFSMTTLDIVFAIILLVAAVFLTVAVLMQSGKSHNLSGTIAGGADTFFGKTKGKTVDRILSKVTTVVAIAFALLVIVVYVIQDDNVVTQDSYIDDYISHIDETEAETTAVEDAIETTAEGAAEGAADTSAAE